MPSNSINVKIKGGGKVKGGRKIKGDGKTKVKTKVKARAKVRAKGSLTHSELNKALQIHGVEIAKLLKKSKFSIDPNPGALSARIEVLKFIKDRAQLTTSKKFGDYYRGLQDRQDELVSTSSVRELIIGALGTKKTLSPNDANEINKFFQSLSDVRFATRWSGFANSKESDGDERMQHPTSATIGGIWRNTLESGDGNPHSELDEKRKQAILEEMNIAIKSSSPVKIAKAMLVRAITFTLNEFTAPATASDQYPLGNISQQELREQVIARESLKAYAVKLGADQERTITKGPDRNSLRTRPWGNRKNKRSLSPSRDTDA
jgi:hypothetical protein